LKQRLAASAVTLGLDVVVVYDGGSSPSRLTVQSLVLETLFDPGKWG